MSTINKKFKVQAKTTMFSHLHDHLCPSLQSMAVFVKIFGAPKTRIWVLVRKKWSGEPGKIFHLTVPEYLSAALYFKAWL